MSTFVRKEAPRLGRLILLMLLQACPPLQLLAQDAGAILRNRTPKQVLRLRSGNVRHRPQGPRFPRRHLPDKVRERSQ